jgi:hypothetical protein
MRTIKATAVDSSYLWDIEKSIVWIKWIGTHGDYDRIDVTKLKRAKRAPLAGITPHVAVLMRATQSPMS